MAKVLYFAILKEAVQVDSEEFQVETEMTIADLLTALYKSHPELKKYNDIISVACNGEYCSKNHRISNADEIALIPPISGGARG